MKKLLSQIGNNESIAGYMFILPNLLGFLVFTSLPVLASLGLSFVDWDILTPPKFVGFANFINLLGYHHEAGHLVANDPLFWKYLYNTAFFMLNIPVCMIGALVVALLMNQKLRGITIYRTIFFLPSICAGSGDLPALAVDTEPGFRPDKHVSCKDIWRTAPRDSSAGLALQHVLGKTGSYADGVLEFNRRGMNMILYLAALQNVPRELYEAAEIDGANGWKKFWAVTVPFISPTTFFITIMSIIGGFQGGFMQAYVMTGGGPAGSTTTIEYYIYNNAYQYFKMGYASSIAWFLFLVIFLVTLINWRFGGKLVHY